MDLPNDKYFQAPSMLASYGESPLDSNTNLFGKSEDSPFAEAFPDPLCKLKLIETSEFVKSLPMANGNTTESRGFLEVSAQRRREGNNCVTQRRIEVPSTPGRPIFSFTSVGSLSRKSFPSKWDDAEKWLMSTSCHNCPAHTVKATESSKISSIEISMHQYAVPKNQA